MERRDQRHRAEARVLQRLLKGLGDVASHRGGRLSRLGEAFRVALQLPDTPFATSAATVAVDADMGEAEEEAEMDDKGEDAQGERVFDMVPMAFVGTEPILLEPKALIHLSVYDQQGNEACYKINKSTPLRKLMDLYCHGHELQTSQVRFFVDGLRIAPDDTAEKLALVDEGRIDVTMAPFQGDFVDVAPHGEPG
jgi:hypothetical protein